jgi:hypothetical protein
MQKLFENLDRWMILVVCVMVLSDGYLTAIETKTDSEEYSVYINKTPKTNCIYVLKTYCIISIIW